MPANIECPCGHIVRVPDEMVNTRIKCPVCGELLAAESARPEVEQSNDADPEPAEPSRNPANSPATSRSTKREPSEPKTKTSEQTPSTTNAVSRKVSSFHAKGGFLFAGLPIPSFFVDSSVNVLPERVRIKAAGLFGSRRVDLRLSEVTSVETRRCLGWYLLPLGVLFLPANGSGLILILLFPFVRHSYLIVKCGTATVAVRFKGNDSDACAIGDAILQAAQTAGSATRSTTSID
ncbi:MAG: hypothetical protein ACI8P0_002072 [Planctomycetaceae bacterium]|jgi:hypothetical protein